MKNRIASTLLLLLLLPLVATWSQTQPTHAVVIFDPADDPPCTTAAQNDCVFSVTYVLRGTTRVVATVPFTDFQPESGGKIGAPIALATLRSASGLGYGVKDFVGVVNARNDQGATVSANPTDAAAQVAVHPKKGVLVVR